MEEDIFSTMSMETCLKSPTSMFLLSDQSVEELTALSGTNFKPLFFCNLLLNQGCLESSVFFYFYF